MSGTTNSGRVPRLRFPEFRDDWAVEKLGELGKLSGGGTPDKSVAEYWQGDIPWVSSSDIYEDDIYTISVTRFINKNSISESATKIVPKGSVLFVSRVGTGKLAVNDREVCTSQDFMNFIPKKVSSYFLGYFFIANKSALVSLGQGTSIKGFSKGDLEKLEVSFPSEPEQQQIADCLSSLDKLITLEAQKLDALKTHKKGLMQQLSPAEGETVPRLRFPEFRGAGGWDTKQLEEFAVIVRGGSPRPIEAFLTTDHNSINWLKIGDIDKESKFITATQEKVIPAALSKTRVVYPGDLILSNSMSFGRPYILKIETCIHDGWIAISEIHADIDRDYLYYLLMTSDSQEYFSSNAAGSGVQNLNADIIKRLPIPYPGIKEQQKIADCLSSLDDLITAQDRKIESLKTHKKGLMQQLFPVLEDTVA